MKRSLRFLAALLSAVLLVSLLPGMASALVVKDSGYTKLGSLPNDYVATQGMCSDGKYIYTFKMPSGNNNLARFYRTTISSGSTSVMQYTDDTSIVNFVELGHGNDMCAVVYNGVTYLYLATMYHKSHSTFATHSIWKFKVSGNTLKKVAYYDVVQGSTNRNFTGLTLFKQTDTSVTLLGANGANFYAMEIPHNQASGTVSCTKAFSIDYTSSVSISGATTYNYKNSSGTVLYDVQGMTYSNGRIYYVMTAGSNNTPRNKNYILVYDISDYPGNTGTRKPIASESIFMTSSTYSYFYEIESVDIKDGVLYYAANAGKSGYYENYDMTAKFNTKFATTPEYTVTFCNEDGTTLQTVKVLQGNTASYSGSTPTKKYDDSNHYTFSKWLSSVGGSAATLSNIQGDMKVYAGYTATAHSYTGKVTVEPTCTTEGTRVLTCSCGHSYSEAVAVIAHSPIVVDGKEATCTETGYTGNTVCSVCNAPIASGTVIDLLPHSPTVINAKEATCSEAGYTGDTVCSVCNVLLETGSATETIAHTPAEDRGYAPTCTEEGLSDGFHCSKCGTVLEAQVVLPATGHTEVVTPGTPPTCLNSGLSDSKSCVVCGVVLQAQEVLPRLGHSYTYVSTGEKHVGTCERCNKTVTQAHSYTGGQCICGAKEAGEPEHADLTIMHTLNLASDISINYVVTSASLVGYEEFYMNCEIPVYENNKPVGTKVEKLTPELRGNLYYFVLTGINAVSMTNDITATLCLSKDGKEYVSSPDVYSVASYAYAQLDKTSVATELKTLCADLLRYGTAAQIYKNYRTDSLADGAMTETHKSYLSVLEDVTFGTDNRILDDLASPTVTWVGKTLALDSKVSVKFVFDASAFAGAPEELSLRISYLNYDGVDTTVTLTDIEAYNAQRNQYSFTFDGLLAAELRSVLSAAVYHGDSRVSPTMEYTGSAYGNGKTGTLLDVCKALFAYSDSALNYFK